MKPNKQTVYLNSTKTEAIIYNDGWCIAFIPSEGHQYGRLNTENSIFKSNIDGKTKDIDNEVLLKKEGYFFTQKQLNEYTTNVIKQALFSASEFVELQYECGKKSKENCLAVFCENCTEQVDKQSITNTFEETFKKFEV